MVAGTTIQGWVDEIACLEAFERGETFNAATGAPGRLPAPARLPDVCLEGLEDVSAYNAFARRLMTLDEPLAATRVERR